MAALLASFRADSLKASSSNLVDQRLSTVMFLYVWA